MNRRQQEILERIKEREKINQKIMNEIVKPLAERVTLLMTDFRDAVINFNNESIKIINKIAKKKEKTYRFEISGFCEIDIDATSMEEAEEKCEEVMREIFDKDLFTDYRFVEEVEAK
ncbi:hypothetical protein [Helcococcus kunzii]|uniref:hypothetical protein n=1 Tax=Helcococcus kunzii TaxID=40091 RepID=UPI00389D6660